MRFTIYSDRAGEFRWRLRPANGRIIADSAEGYRTKADCQAGIQLVNSGAQSASVIDDTASRAGYRW